MTELRLRKRHRLRQKEIASIARRIDESLGSRSFDESDVVDMAEAPEYMVVYVGGKILAFLPGGTPFLTVRGLLRYGATKRFVTVDMGAVRFVYNGADVMGPGIVGHDPGISVGDLVWVRDVQNLRPLAVGRALVPAEGMARKDKGKAVESVHHVGDKLWAADEPKPDEDGPAA
ncbi:MAG: RNA-binding protein [Euryarchaeota archaeon RBG_16_62_10]|nr:MAG: RNA-binding protein [Euryarchaeota archaeon RBG_16_62_10]